MLCQLMSAQYELTNTHMGCYDNLVQVVLVQQSCEECRRIRETAAQ